MLNVKHWRQGIGTELLFAIMNHASEFNKTVVATVNVDNAPSLRLLEKAGISSVTPLDDETLKVRLK